MSRTGSRTHRKNSATSLAELPLALLIVFIFGVFPFMALCTICLRAAFVHLACFDAARAVAVAKTFQTSDAGAPSAIQLADQKVKSIIGNFTGITLNDAGNGSMAKIEIVVTPVASPDNSLVYDSPLSPPIQTDQFIYQYRVTVSSDVEPIVKASGGLLAGIPGFSAPIPLKVTASTWCENPSGLVK